MIRPSIMLSDTAMVLLERRRELQDAWNDFRQQELTDDKVPDFPSWDARYGDWDKVHHTHSQIDAISRALLLDLWCVWMARDLPLAGHLPWRMTLGSDLVEAMEATFGLQTSYPPFLRDHPLSENMRDGMRFIKAVDQAYRAEWIIHMGFQGDESNDR